METLSINIKNPKAKKLIIHLAELDLIEINKPKQKIKDFQADLEHDINCGITMDEIVAEVKIVRQERYDAKMKNK